MGAAAPVADPRMTGEMAQARPPPVVVASGRAAGLAAGLVGSWAHGGLETRSLAQWQLHVLFQITSHSKNFEGSNHLKV